MRNTALFKDTSLYGLLFLLLVSVGCATTSSSGITSSDVATKPTAYCEVLNEPAPVLLGGWQCRATGENSQGIRFNNPVQYWLIKDGDRYALYYYFNSPVSQNIGWQPFIIDGNEIRFSKSDRKFVMENGKVYFVSYGMDKPKVEMTRISDK